MEARIYRTVSFVMVAASACCLGASHRTQNFVSTAATQELAVEIGEAAEKFRRDLAIEWLGAELPPWEAPCPIQSQVSPRMGAGGATSFMFNQGRPFGWTMGIQGSRERILDSVLPHEVTHTIFATHFGRPLPRWADEGACTTVEHASERGKQQEFLIEFLTTNRGIAFNKMFAMTEYPRDMMPLYSQGYSVVRYLIAQGGKRKFVQYVGDGMRTNNWTAATEKHYGYKSLSELQVTWLEWVRGGSREIRREEQLASHTPAQVKAVADPRGNTPSGLVPVAPLGEKSPKSDRIVSTPHMSTTASASLAHGWYAKRRDQALAERGPVSSDARGTTSAASGDTGHSPPHVYSRPQPPVRPEQTILEWTRQPSAPQFAPGPLAAPIRR